VSLLSAHFAVAADKVVALEKKQKPKSSKLQLLK
jgi:hypothetical protein